VYGVSLASDKNRLNGLLRDSFPKRIAEVNVLIYAIELGIVNDIYSERSSQIPKTQFYESLISRLQHDYGTEIGLAKWAVETWAIALGLKIPLDEERNNYDQYSIDDFDEDDLSLEDVEEQGDADAQRNLGRMYENGRGVKQDDIQVVVSPGSEIFFQFCPIFAGTFNMKYNEVKIEHNFYLGKYPVTQQQWKAVMGNNPSDFKGASLPVEKVSFDDVQVFIQKLNQLAGKKLYRLPTEEEWEYAGRAGSTSKYYFGDNASQLGKYAWYNRNSGDTTHSVGQKKPNGWGLYDMAGNVWEWTDSWYDSSRSNRMIRGGSWFNYAEDCRSDIRLVSTPDNRCNIIGFRLVFVPDLAKEKRDRDAAFLRANREPVASPVPVSAKRFAIGQQYGGGIIFYVDESGQSGLIAAKSDIPGPYFTWSDSKAACKRFVSGDYRDWRLPTKDELNKLYFKNSVVGGFADSYYWSSTENGADNAWSQYFGNGGQDWDGKAGYNRVRAVRAFTY
jgi:hypothetical protein